MPKTNLLFCTSVLIFLASCQRKIPEEVKSAAYIPPIATASFEKDGSDYFVRIDNLSEVPITASTGVSPLLEWRFTVVDSAGRPCAYTLLGKIDATPPASGSVRLAEVQPHEHQRYLCPVNKWFEMSPGARYFATVSLKVYKIGKRTHCEIKSPPLELAV